MSSKGEQVVSRLKEMSHAGIAVGFYWLPDDDNVRCLAIVRSDFIKDLGVARSQALVGTIAEGLKTLAESTGMSVDNLMSAVKAYLDYAEAHPRLKHGSAPS